MNQAEKAELLEQIEKWNDADEFARCIEAIGTQSPAISI